MGPAAQPRLWHPDEWAPDGMPGRAEIVHALERRGEPLEAVRQHYGPGYADTLY